MARNLFVLSALSLVLVGCFGPDRAPSPVTDGGAPAITGPAVVDNLTPVAPVPATPAAPATKTTAAKTGAKKSTGKLPIGNNAGNK